MTIYPDLPFMAAHKR